MWAVRPALREVTNLSRSVPRLRGGPEHTHKESSMKKLLCAAAAALFAASPAFAAGTLIDFEGATSFASINAYYDGGADSAGAIGPSLGVSFGGDALALQNDPLGPYFSNAPSPL